MNVNLVFFLMFLPLFFFEICTCILIIFQETVIVKFIRSKYRTCFSPIIRGGWYKSLQTYK